MSFSSSLGWGGGRFAMRARRLLFVTGSWCEKKQQVAEHVCAHVNSPTAAGYWNIQPAINHRAHCLRPFVRPTAHPCTGSLGGKTNNAIHSDRSIWTFTLMPLEKWKGCYAAGEWIYSSCWLKINIQASKCHLQIINIWKCFNLIASPTFILFDLNFNIPSIS